ncbi:D-sedoheptulose-7-phosphate isomerase [Citrobacter portucalensis]|uniref:D-sedoheptulose-7-phosphate isomerase n=1 Tax=Citrobacter portucalensis TaxID=1639133 RepID=UPI00226B6E90|nr:SIS domain-containing protein [Citrobacter portucalensis]MCX9024038.1 SIS domain-containing protein [Citrobacter portucalensis]
MKKLTGRILQQTMTDNPALMECESTIITAWEYLLHCFRNDGKLLLCGNGGSASDCEHIVGELMKGFILPRPLPESIKAKILTAWPEQGDYLGKHLQSALPAISLVSHTSLSSAFINDVAADMVYAQQVYGYGRPGDILLALSTSGNAKNVLNAVRIAEVCDMKTIAISGSKGGELSRLAQCVINLPADKTYRIQELTLAVYHCLCAMLEVEIFTLDDASTL